MTERRITSMHGAGGEVMGKLLSELILPRFAGQSEKPLGLSALDDGAILDLPSTGRIVMTTDSHIVKPIFFPGGDIGTLAAAGTLNDLAVMGARPIALTLAAVIEEGFLFSDLEIILDSLLAQLNRVGATICCGDTKVMPAGELDGIVLNTTGIGVSEHPVSDAAICPGDRILVSGTIGDHGMALLAARSDFHLDTLLESDVIAIWPMIERALLAGGAGIRAMKDPTRGGLAAALNEMARKAGVSLELDEAAIPVRDEVRGLSELLGISHLEVANEGKAILVVDPAKAGDVLEALRSHPSGRCAAIIGEATREYPGRVIVGTEVGGRRFLDMPLGDPVPRIC